MWCKRCMNVMRCGTEYHPKKSKDDKGYIRYHKCKICGDKIFTNEPNFQECMNKATEKNRRV